jgi:hypothetical protein
MPHHDAAKDFNGFGWADAEITRRKSLASPPAAFKVGDWVEWTAGGSGRGVAQVVALREGGDEPLDRDVQQRRVKVEIASVRPAPSPPSSPTKAAPVKPPAPVCRECNGTQFIDAPGETRACRNCTCLKCGTLLGVDGCEKCEPPDPYAEHRLRLERDYPGEDIGELTAKEKSRRCPHCGGPSFNRWDDRCPTCGVTGKAIAAGAQPTALDRLASKRAAVLVERTPRPRTWRDKMTGKVVEYIDSRDAPWESEE